VVRTDEDSVRAIRDLGCRPEEDLCASKDSDTGSCILGQKGRGKESDARVRCKRHFPSVCPVWRKELWALSEADRINPAIGGAFLIAMRDEDDAQDVRLPSGE